MSAAHHQSPTKKRLAEESENDPKKAKNNESHSPASRTRSKGGPSASSSSSSASEIWTNKTPVPGLAPVSGQNPRYHTLTFYLPIQGAADAIEWYKKVFNAREVTRFDSPDHKIVFHAEMSIGDSLFMLSDDMARGVKNPKALGGASVNLCLQVPDVDTSFKLALDNGAKEVRPLENQFYGDRNCQLLDPFGHSWTIATTVKEVTNEEMLKAMADMSAGNGADAQNGKEKGEEKA
jgi:PhnB protein